MPGCIPFDRTTDPDAVGPAVGQAAERGLPFSGVVWRASRAERRGVERRESTARLETEIANLLSAVHTVQSGNA